MSSPQLKRSSDAGEATAKLSALELAIAEAEGVGNSSGGNQPTAAGTDLSGRFEALDFIRGLAVGLMILSHGVKGLMSFEQMPDWGLVPVHLVTKISSSLFILVFGMTLSMFFVPHAGTSEWPRKRKKLLIRGLVVFFWYKALTVVEMSHLFNREDIWNALLYKTFPVYVEILGYYSIALLWIPWTLPIWKACHWLLKAFIPVMVFGISYALSKNFDYFGSETLQAILVEHSDHYTWGQLSRAPLVFVGLLIGGLLQWSGKSKKFQFVPSIAMGGIALLLTAMFVKLSGNEISIHFIQIAKNEGKHPPEMLFMLFSLAGAFAFITLALLGGNKLAKWLGIFTTIGKSSLQAFIFHIIVLFVFYRFLFDYFHKVEYTFALSLSGVLILLTYIWVKLMKWVRTHS